MTSLDPASVATLHKLSSLAASHMEHYLLCLARVLLLVHPDALILAVFAAKVWRRVVHPRLHVWW